MSRRTLQLSITGGVLALVVCAIALSVRPAYSDAHTSDPAPARALKQAVLREEVAKILSVTPPAFRVDTLDIRAADGAHVRMDSIAIIADSSSYASLQQAGFLRNAVGVYNQRQRRLMMAAADRSGAWLDSARRVPGGLLAVRGHTVRRVVLAPPSSQVSDAARQPVSVTFRGSRVMGALVDAHGFRVALFDSGGSGEAASATGCRFDPAEKRSLRLRCADRAGDGGVVLHVFANEAQPLAGFAFTRERGIMALNGTRVGASGSVKPGDLLAMGSRQFLYSVVHSAPIVPAQHVNDEARVSSPADSALRFLMPLAYARLSDDDAAIETTLDQVRSHQLQSALEAALAEGNGDAEYAVVVQADVRTGEIVAVAQVGDLTTVAGRWRLLEPMYCGSCAKPLLFAAVLSQRPELLSFRTRDDGSGVPQLLGGFVPFDPGDGRCPDGMIGIVAAIACSSNAFAIALVAKGFPVLAQGVDGLYSVSLMEATVDRPPSRLELWGSGDDTAVPAVLEPSASRLLVKRAVGTRKPDAKDLVSLALGARAGNWTLLDVAQGYVRLMSGRETSLRMIGQGEPGAPWPFAGAAWHEAVLEGMERVVAAGGTGQRMFESGMRPRSPVVLAKTGHLNQNAGSATDARTGTVVIATGERATAGSRRLRCGTVTVTHVIHRLGVRDALDKVAERTVARLSKMGALDHGCNVE